MKGKKITSLPFIYGAQYYRAPTPHRRHWKADLARMADAGFNTVKFWAQWRWGHRAIDRFYFDDLDELMDLASACGLAVTVNTIFDVSPSWLLAAYPDSRMVAADGSIVESCAVSCRQIGGYPGPCLNHGPAWDARRHFLEQLVTRYTNHPAMGMWDVWNEPELDLTARIPDVRTMRCYCKNCKEAFIIWLREKYRAMERLNEVWGRCYEDWQEIELPRQRETLIDMVDWRLFHLDSVSREARRRIECVKSLDGTHPVYLHPVPNTLHPFNAVTCADDFQLAAGCDCFGGTINGTPASPLQAISAAQGRICYNVESHLRAGQIGLSPKSLTVDDFVRAFVPQIALGIKGFLHWQYRAETLGAEAPAWGLLETDGSVGATHAAAQAFWAALSPFADRMIEARPRLPQAAIYKSTANEIVHFCAHGNLNDLKDSVDGFTKALYDLNVGICYVNDQMVRSGLPESIRLLVLPMTWALDQPTADALARWVRNGGTLLCEGLTGCFDLTTGRYSPIVPGLGLSEVLGLRETNGTAAMHLTPATRRGPAHLSGDVAKAVEALASLASTATSDAPAMLELILSGGGTMRGRTQYAELQGECLRPLAALPGRKPCFVERVSPIGGAAFYAGTQIGWQVTCGESHPAWLTRALAAARIDVPGPDRRLLRIDPLSTADGEVVVMANLTNAFRNIEYHFSEPMTGVFSRSTAPSGVSHPLSLDPREVEIFIPTRWLSPTNPLPKCEPDERSKSAVTTLHVRPQTKQRPSLA